MNDGETPSVRRRTDTRRRLLAAAADLFEASGTIGQSVEALCARAGFTRGAFYSNFTSVDQLYLALHEEQAGRVWHRLWAALEAQTSGEGRQDSLEKAVGHLLDSLPDSREWFSLRSVLLARAAADPDFADTMRIDDGAVAAQLGARFIALAAVHGREPVVEPALLAKAVVAAHVGAVGQAAVDPDGVRTQVVAVTAVIRGLTVESAAP